MEILDEKLEGEYKITVYNDGTIIKEIVSEQSKGIDKIFEEEKTIEEKILEQQKQQQLVLAEILKNTLGEN